MKLPNPEPEDVNPSAMAKRFSKYRPGKTREGPRMIPNPIPEKRKKIPNAIYV
jgi:hypothetical protein